MKLGRSLYPTTPYDTAERELFVQHSKIRPRSPVRHLCTGYIKYHQAVRDVILADPVSYLSRA